MSRNIRLAGLLKREVINIIRNEVSDPRIGFISITDVSVSPDLKNAKIFVSIMGNEEQKQAGMDGLTSATSFIRGKLAGILEIRSVPQITFSLDDSIERGSKVLSLIAKLNNDKNTPKPNRKRTKKS